MEPRGGGLGGAALRVLIVVVVVHLVAGGREFQGVEERVGVGGLVESFFKLVLFCLFGEIFVKNSKTTLQ